MTEIQFSLPEKYEYKKQLIIRKNNDDFGDYQITETKDVSIFFLTFDNDSLGAKFQRKLDNLIPDLYNY